MNGGQWVSTLEHIASAYQDIGTRLDKSGRGFGLHTTIDFYEGFRA